MRVTNVLTARRPLVIGGKFFFLVRGLLVKSFQLPEETLMKEYCGMGGSHVASIVVAFATGESASPVCDGVIALETLQNSQYRCVMIHRLQHKSKVPKFVTPTKPLSEMTF